MIRTGIRIAVVLILMLLAAETILRLFPLPDPYAERRAAATSPMHRFLPSWHIYPGWFGRNPPFSVTFVTGPLNGVSTRQVVHRVNRLGYPYDEAKGRRHSARELRVAVIGGSTVECAALEESKRWPAVLERRLADALPGRPVTVLNLGVSATDTRAHLATVAQHAVKLDLDYMVFLLGANDLSRSDSAFHPLLGDEALIERDFPFVRGLLLNLQLARRVRVLSLRLRGAEYFAGPPGPDEPYFTADAHYRASLPVLPTAGREISAEALRDYDMNIASLAGLAAIHGITPIFVTQPMLWKPDMSPGEEAVDWLGALAVKDGRRYRVPAGEKARLMETLNRQLRATCAARGLRCIDIEPRIPRTLEYFYDSVHLNESGADAVARQVAEFMVQDGLR
jgi:lysophospholipase L1-like esterase